MKVNVAVCLLIVCLFCWEANARRKHRERLPIKDEQGQSVNNNNNHHRHGESRKKASECRFADQRFELEQTWNPDLGSPFGVMYCIHCECVPVHKKRRIVGRVACKNIKTECPKVTCQDPILLPGRCCKVCPGSEDYNPDLMIEVDLKREEEEKNGRHYAALLTRPANAVANSHDDAWPSAAGRLYFRKKTLSYSFVTSEDFGATKLVTFLDGESHIIEEFPMVTTHFQNETGKVCGLWHRLPKRYRRQLRRDEIFVQLTNENGDAIGGRVAKHYGLSSELFSGLIRSAISSGGAATAIVSLSSQTGGVHVNLVMSGIFKTDGEKNVGLLVKFECNHEGETRTISEDLVIPKVNQELTSIDFKTVFDSPELSALGRGQLSLTVAAKNYPQSVIWGPLAPRFSCDLFDCILSPLSAATEPEVEDEEEDHVAETEARGLAWMTVDQTGLIKYNVHIQDLSSPVDSIQIDNGRKSRRLLRLVHDLEYVEAGGGGWANGTMRLVAGDVEDLYQADLFVNVATENNERELRGRIVPQLMGPEHEWAVAPVALVGDPPNRTMISGLAWANVDPTCRLNYKVRLTGVEKTTESKLVLKDHPMRNLKALTLIPGRHLDLQDFVGPEASGHMDDIHKLTMARMDSGDASFNIVHGGEDAFLVEGKISGVKAPSDCLPRFSRNDLELMPGYLSDLGEASHADKEFALKCVYEGTRYEDGSQWTATHESCKKCFCKRGSVQCDSILCPATSCSNPVIPEGECCATCPDHGNSSSTSSSQQQGCYLNGDKQFHLAGSKWHPYIPPWGFSRCTICSCPPDTLQVECHTKKCPQLDCPAELQSKQDALTCCKACVDPPPMASTEPPTTPDPEQLQDMGVERNDEDVIREGGCLWRDETYENGHVWSPRVLPYGEVNCVTCRCKDGESKCTRKHCPVMACMYKVYEKNSCCPRCAANKAEKRKAQKVQRILKLRRLRRLRRMRQHQHRN